MSTVGTYLQRPATEVLVASAAQYYALAKQRGGQGDPNAVLERGRQAGAALGSRPGAAIRGLVDHVLAEVRAASADPIIETIAGGMRLTAYLPTRTFELVVHSTDIAAAVGIAVTIPTEPLMEAMQLASDVACLLGDGQSVLRSLTGRERLPAGYSVV